MSSFSNLTWRNHFSLVRVEKRKMKSEDPGILRVLQINFKYNYSGGIMKNMMKNQSLVILGSLAGICLLGTVAFANPSLVPDHPGYPMKESKSPVSGVSTANDPGQENLYGQNALNAATKEYTKDMKTRRSGVPEANESESQNQMGERNQMKGHNQMSDQNK